MRVLVACEFSGTVRDAFAAKGHDAWSCDLLASETTGNHHRGDVLEILDDGWDLMIAHPPCTHLAVSGARWFKDKQKLGLQDKALEFVRALLEAPIPRIALENPVSVIASKIRRPDQIIQPWQFGDGETKAVCLWLKNLPPLRPTNVVQTKYPKVWLERRAFNKMESYLQKKARSRFFTSVAAAMADQWGSLDA
jgi:site-specific DNA-cytosine methylase